MLASLQEILEDYRKYWVIATASIIVASLVDLLDLVMPYAIGQIINFLSDRPLDVFLQRLINFCSRFTPTTPEYDQTLWLLLGFIFLVSVVRAPVQSWAGNWFNFVIPIRTSYEQMEKAIAKLLSLPLDFYEESNPGRIFGLILQGAYSHISFYPGIAAQLVPKLVRVIGIAILMVLIDWRIAIIFSISFIVILGFSLQGLISTIERDKSINIYQEKTNSRTSEIITNIKTIKSFTTEYSELNRQSQRINRYLTSYLYRIHKKLVEVDTWRRIAVQSCIFFILALTLLEVVQGEISIGHFITIFVLLNTAYSDLYPISQASEQFARHYPSLSRFHEFMRQPVGQDASALVVAPKGDNLQKLTGKVQFSSLSFGYDAKRLVLEDINLLIEPCQTVALVGRSGAGKSTLVKLLSRYFEPSQGKILVDGEEIQNLDVSHYRRQLAIVHQEVDVFNATLLDNLRYGNPEASFEQVKEACCLAKVDEFVDDLPKGYHTIIGERGMRLSGGQRQRLGIARALLVDPSILIFDEATSSLDYESERSIQLAMKSILGTRTTIIIAHRLSTVREADKIVVLDQGKIVEVGNHKELLEHGGVYQYLHSLQESGDILALAT